MDKTKYDELMYKFNTLEERIVDRQHVIEVRHAEIRSLDMLNVSDFEEMKQLHAEMLKLEDLEFKETAS